MVGKVFVRDRASYEAGSILIVFLLFSALSGGEGKGSTDSVWHCVSGG